VSTEAWTIGIIVPVLLLLLGFLLNAALSRATASSTQKTAVTRVARPVGLVLVMLLLVLAGGLIHATFFDSPAESQVEPPSASSCPDGESFKPSTPITTENGQVIAQLEVFHSRDCGVSWARLTPSTKARGVKLQVNLSIRQGRNRRDVQRETITTPVQTGTLIDNGSNVLATAQVLSNAGSATATTRSFEIKNK